MTKEEKILNKFYNIGATDIAVRCYLIMVTIERKKTTGNSKYVIRFDKREKTYEKFEFVELTNAWCYHFSAKISYPITNAEHRIITELFDYWRKVEWKKKKKKLR